jgi:hypothetical protein
VQDRRASRYPSRRGSERAGTERKAIAGAPKIVGIFAAPVEPL